VKIGIVFEEPEREKPDEEDILDEVKTVTGALKRLDYEYALFTINGNNQNVFSLVDELFLLIAEFKAYQPTLLFNLVESHRSNIRLLPAIAAFFELAGQLYTGASYDAILTTTDKSLAKAIMLANNIATSKWAEYRGKGIEGELPPFPVIVKPSWEDASVGINDCSVIYGEKVLMDELPGMFASSGRQKLILESYIEGHEFNVSMIEHPDGQVEVLPIAEMQFLDWPGGKPKIVGYDAKWLKDTFEYTHTARSFDIDPHKAPLDEIAKIALKCWRVFNLRGYARVDMRMDGNGGLFVIDINANPGIAPDAGFIASARKRGYSDEDIIRSIIEAALMRRS
jgi:D-alanine-D-alanine ligase